MPELPIFFGGTIIDWNVDDLIECETPEQIKVRRAMEKEKKKNPNQSSLFMDTHTAESQKFYTDHPELCAKTTEELINDLPF